MVRQDPIDPQRDYSNHMSPSPTAETAQIGQVDGEYEKKRKCAAPSICSTQSGVIFGNTHLGSDYIELICSMNCGDICAGINVTPLKEQRVFIGPFAPQKVNYIMRYLVICQSSHVFKSCQSSSKNVLLWAVH